MAHLVGLVQPERPTRPGIVSCRSGPAAVRMDVYTFALGQLCHPDDREQRLLCSDFHTREGYRGQADLHGPICIVAT